jgi:hypothetical protein
LIAAEVESLSLAVHCCKPYGTIVALSADELRLQWGCREVVQRQAFHINVTIRRAGKTSHDRPRAQRFPRMREQVETNE